MKNNKKRAKSINLLEKEIEKYIKEVKPKINSIMESSVLSLIGLEKRYGENYEIDHCNSRNSVLIDAFKSIAVNEAKRLASTYKPTKEDVINFKEAFKKEYKNQMNYVLRDKAKKKVDGDLNRILETIKIDIDDIIQDKLEIK